VTEHRAHATSGQRAEKCSAFHRARASADTPGEDNLFSASDDARDRPRERRITASLQMFADGHVERVSVERLTELLQAAPVRP
jgi:hypothetical protein